MIGNHVGGKHCLKGSNPLLSVSYLQTGPLVKRLRHRPFTAVTRVRVPYGSFIFIVTFLFGGLAQLSQVVTATMTFWRNSEVAKRDGL